MSENDVLFALIVAVLTYRLTRAGLTYRATQRAADRKTKGTQP